LTGKYGPEADKLVYRFVDHGEREVACATTTPCRSRVIAMNQNPSMPCYAVVRPRRADKPQQGRLREFYQCDVDTAALMKHELTQKFWLPATTSCATRR
jgi:histidyl-tRNA synthetase